MNPSLSDLDKEPVIKTDILPGDGEPSAADLEAERQKQLAADKPKPLVDQTPEARLAAEKAETERLEAERIAKEGKGEDGDEPVGSIWDDVDKLRGEALNVEWGDIPEEDRDTPQGILIRERALEARAVTRFEENIMKTDPRGYQYLLHRQAGGTDEDFFAQKTIELPDYELFKTSIDLQTKVYSDALRNRGLPEKQVKMLVDQAVKDKEIEALADKEYKAKEAQDAKSIRELNQQLEQSQKSYSQAVQNLGKAIDETINSKDLTMVVPEAQREGFSAFVRQHIKYDEENGVFMLAQVISQKNLPRQLEAMFLQFKNGNLGDIVRREAETANTRRLRRKVDQSREPIRDGGTQTKGKKTLGDL